MADSILTELATAIERAREWSIVGRRGETAEQAVARNQARAVAAVVAARLAAEMRGAAEAAAQGNDAKYADDIARRLVALLEELEGENHG